MLEHNRYSDHELGGHGAKKAEKPPQVLWVVNYPSYNIHHAQTRAGSKDEAIAHVAARMGYKGPDIDRIIEHAQVDEIKDDDAGTRAELPDTPKDEPVSAAQLEGELAGLRNGIKAMELHKQSDSVAFKADMKRIYMIKGKLGIIEPEEWEKNGDS